MVKMPQRQRHNTGGGTGGADLPLLDPGVIEAHNSVTTSRCCVPLSSGCLKNYEPINLDTPTGCVRVICNNENCTVGTLMHKECFNAWETHVLGYLRSCGRARSWSEKQRLQNLWTKKGYDLAYRACSCLCARGHLRKDLNWVNSTELEEDSKSKKKKKSRQNNRPALVTMGPGALNNNLTNNNNNNNNNNKININNDSNNINMNSNSNNNSSTTVNLASVNSNNNGQSFHRHRTSSISSTGSSPPSDSPHSPQHNGGRRRSKDLFSERNR